MSFGDRVKKAREMKGLTQVQFGELIGVKKSSVSGYENGSNSPNVDQIERIIAALDVDANYLWGIKNDYSEFSELIRAYSTAPEILREAVCRVLGIDYKPGITSYAAPKYIDEEILLSPENQEEIAPVRLIENKEHIEAFYEKNPAFIEAIKEMNFLWDGRKWSREIDQFSGPLDDRIAETAARLLNKGFSVIIPSTEIRDKVINNSYEPECTRWIYRKKDGLLRIIFERNDALYHELRAIRGIRYSAGGFDLNVAYHETLADYARIWGFKYTDKALELIEAWKEKQQKKYILPDRKIEKQPDQGIKVLLEVEPDIIEDLLDED